MTALTVDLDFEELAGCHISLCRRNVSMQEEVSGTAALRCPRQLDDGKVPPAFHELDDQVQTPGRSGLTGSYRPSWS